MTVSSQRMAVEWEAWLGLELLAQEFALVQEFAVGLGLGLTSRLVLELAAMWVLGLERLLAQKSAEVCLRELVVVLVLELAAMWALGLERLLALEFAAVWLQELVVVELAVVGLVVVELVVVPVLELAAMWVLGLKRLLALEFAVVSLLTLVVV